MYFTISCPSCEKHLKVRSEHAGRRAGCPYCGHTVTIPQPAEEQHDGVEEYLPESEQGLEGRKAREERSARRRGKSADAHEQASSEVSPLIASGIALGATLLFFLLLWPAIDTDFGKLFFKEGAGSWVPIALVYLLCWSVTILGFKWHRLTRQRATMLFDMLPTELGSEINAQNVGQFIDHVYGLPVPPTKSYLVNRVARGLEHFRLRKNTPEVSSMLASQSEIDATTAYSGYTMLKVFVWAIPIVGFIGTVIGFSAAVGGFSGSISGSELAQLKESLGGITTGLSTAFDTTLVALVMSLLVMFPTSALQNSEESLLNWVDEYCNENLLKRLNDRREGGAERGSGGSRSELKQMIDAAMADHHAELKAWSRKLETIGKNITAQVANAWSEINQQIEQRQQDTMSGAQEVERMSNQFQVALHDMALNNEALQDGMSSSLNESAQTLRKYVDDLQRGLQGLSEVLERLGEQQVLIQQQPRRRGWLFGRGNGGS